MKIAFCDLEGTLIEVWGWWYIKDFFGAKKLSDEYAELYKEGKVGFEEWRRELSRVWKENKVTKKQFEEKLKNYKYLPGAKELISGLKKKGYYIVIVTGAVSVLAEMIAKELQIDELICGHEFIFNPKGEFLDIKTHPTYRRGEGKVHFIKQVIEKNKVKKENCIAIGGDDINDLWMMKELKSFSVNPKVRVVAEVVDYEVKNLKEILKYV